MITFKQFIAEIDMIDGKEYSTHDSDNSASEHDYRIKQEKKKGALTSYTPFESKFNNKDFELLQHIKGNELTIVLVHKKSGDAAINLMLERTTINLNGEKFEFWSTDVLSGLKKYQGQGLSPLVYQAVINSGRFIIGSSHEQTEGGSKTWAKLLKIIDEPVYVVSEEKPGSFVLLKGKLAELKKVAYESYHNRFMIIPSNLAKEVVSKAIDVESK